MKFTIKGDHRPLGLYVAGNPGQGKSSLLQHLALCDIRANRGVAVIDPTGDLVNRLVHHIPKEQAKKTIFFDTDNPVPIDFFSYENPAERQVLTDQLLDIFDLEGAPVSKPNLQKILGTLFDANDNPKIPDAKRCTFLDVRDFITNEKRRNEILGYAPKRKPDWEGDQFKPIDYNSITKRMTPFFEIPALNVMFGARKPKLKISDVIRDNLIFLVNIKDTPSDFDIAALITAKFQQATFGRRYIPEGKRTPYYLYIDECHTILAYAEEQFEAILTRARKFKLCLTLANQIPSDLPPGILRKLGTIQSLYLFQLEPDDARIFKNRLAPYIPEHLMNLGKFQAIARTGGGVFFIRSTPKPLGFSSASYAEAIRKRTVDIYGCNPRAESLHTTSTNCAANPDEDDKSERSPSISAITSKKKDSRSAG